MLDTRLLHLAASDLYHLKDVIPAYAESLGGVSNNQALKTYLGFDQDCITLLTSGVAGIDKVNGYPKHLKMDLKQKDTSFT